MSLQKTFPLYLAAEKAVKPLPREEQTIAIKRSNFTFEREKAELLLEDTDLHVL